MNTLFLRSVSLYAFGEGSESNCCIYFSQPLASKIFWSQAHWFTGQILRSSEYLTFCNNFLIFITSSGFRFKFNHIVRDWAWLPADTSGEHDYALSLHFATRTFPGGSLDLLANLSRYFCASGFGRTRLFYWGFLLRSLEYSAFDFAVAVGHPKVVLAKHSEFWVNRDFLLWCLELRCAGIGQYLQSMCYRSIS